VIGQGSDSVVKKNSMNIFANVFAGVVMYRRKVVCNNLDFQPISRFVYETLRYMPIVKMEDKSKLIGLYYLSNSVIFKDHDLNSRAFALG